MPLWASLGLSVLGAMTVATGVLSKCSIYYLLGHSTCPVARPSRAIGGEAPPVRKPAA